MNPGMDHWCLMFIFKLDTHAHVTGDHVKHYVSLVLLNNIGITGLAILNSLVSRSRSTDKRIQSKHSEYQATTLKNLQR